MASVEGKVNVDLNQVTEDSRDHMAVGARNFKVYSETEKVKEDPNTIKTTVPVKKVAVPSIASDTKGILNKMEHNKGKGTSTAKKQVGRKALVDISNIESNIRRNVVHDGSKSLKGQRTAFLQRVLSDSGARTANVSSRKSFTGKVRANTNRCVGDVHTSKKGIKDLASSSDDLPTMTKDSSCKSVVTACRISRNPPIPARKSLSVVKGVNQSNTNTAKAPIMKTTLLASSARGTLQSKFSSSLKKPVSFTAVAYKKKREVVRSSLPDNVSNEVVKGKPSIDGNINPSTNSSDIIEQRKSNRRRSYTSLLMATSKLLDENSKVKQENLPSIDDDCNQLEVAEYVDEIYQYYWVMEAQNPPLENYMSIQKDVTPQMRGILINWLIEVHFKFDLMPETLYLMVTLLDRYLSEAKIKKSEMQLVGLTALLLASKYEDFWHPRVKDLINISAEAYTRDHLLGMEKLILRKLKFRLNVPTPYVFMLRFLKAAQSDTKLEHLAFYLIELSLVEYEALKFKPSLLCASSIYVARCTLQKTPFWTPLLGKHACYNVSQIRECADMILKFHKAAGKGHLKVTHEKYTRTDLSGVAAIRPLDRLPL